MSIDEGMAILIGAGVGAFVPIAALIAQAFLQGKRNTKEQKRQLLYTQLSLFYDPIITLLSVNRDIFSKTGPNSVSKDIPPHLQAEKKMVWDKLVENVIIPNNQRICEIIETKMYLLTPSDDISYYLQFTTHAHAYKVFRGQTYEGYKDFQFPAGFLEHVKDQREHSFSEVEKLK